MTTSTGGPLPKLSSEVTLTKVGAPEKLKDKDKVKIKILVKEHDVCLSVCL